MSSRRVVIARWIALGLMLLAPGEPARSAALDPNSFTSLGALSLSSGNITINSDTLAISGAASFTGVLFDQGTIVQNSVTDFDRQVAVFDFSDINLAIGVGVTITGSRPVALLSRGNLALNQVIGISGANGSGVTGGSASAGGGAGGNGAAVGGRGGGPGGGNGTDTTNFDGGGGAFGGNAGAGDVFSLAGSSYGDLQLRLQGGSGGAGAKDKNFLAAGAGGGGGGALELGAVGSIAVNAQITSNGGSGSGTAYFGGGGSGGGLLLHGSAVYLNAPLWVRGGTAGFAGGGGGGGRITLMPDVASATQIQTMISQSSLIGGSAGAFGHAGRAGVLNIRVGQLTVGPLQAVTLGTVTLGQTGTSDPHVELTTRDLSIALGGLATLNSPNVIASNGIVSVDGTLQAGTFNQTIASISGAGRIVLGAGASLTIGSGNASSNFAGTFEGGGSLIKTGTGEFILSSLSQINAPLRLDGGTLTFNLATARIGGNLTTTAAVPINVTGNSIATFGGGVATAGTITVASGSSAVFSGTLNTATGTSGTGSITVNSVLEAGTGPASLSFGGNVKFGSSASVREEIGGTAAGTQRDLIGVTGVATLAGEMQLKLINGFLPLPGDSFNILNYGTALGDINVVSGAGNLGLGWSKTYSATGLSVSAFPLLPGDANYDGIVDGKDLGRLSIAWQKAGNWLNGDFNSDHIIDVDDLYILATHWGMTVPLNASAVTLPEPTALLFVALPCLRRRRRGGDGNIPRINGRHRLSALK